MLRFSKRNVFIIEIKKKNESRCVNYKYNNYCIKKSYRKKDLFYKYNINVKLFIKLFLINTRFLLLTL